MFTQVTYRGSYVMFQYGLKLASAFFNNPEFIYMRRHVSQNRAQKENQTSETISDSAECYAGLSVRFESSATCL